MYRVIIKETGETAKARDIEYENEKYYGFVELYGVETRVEIESGIINTEYSRDKDGELIEQKKYPEDKYRIERAEVESKPRIDTSRLDPWYDKEIPLNEERTIFDEIKDDEE